MRDSSLLGEAGRRTGWVRRPATHYLDAKGNPIPRLTPKKLLKRKRIRGKRKKNSAKPNPNRKDN